MSVEIGNRQYSIQRLLCLIVSSYSSLAYERADIHLVHHERVEVKMDSILVFDWNERSCTYDRRFRKSIRPTVVVEEVSKVPVIMKMYSMRMTLSIQAIEFITAFVLYMLYLLLDACYVE